MKVSVIIPTYNGEQKVPNILKALRQQSFKDFEVVVVNDGSTDDTVNVLHNAGYGFQSFKVVNQPNKGRACVRNRGAAETKGDLLIFFDDDMRPANDCIQLHVQHHLLFPDSIMTGSQIEEVTDAATDMFRFKAQLSHRWNRAYRSAYPQPLKKEQIFITAANFSILKNTFNLLQGFDERLTDSEDFDLAVRASEAGIPLYVNLQAHAWHDDKVTCAAYIKRLRQYTEANKKLSLLKPELFNNNKYIAPRLNGVKRMIFAAFAFPFWIQWVDKNRFTKVLPRKLRFKLYDYIVTANGVFFPERVLL